MRSITRETADFGKERKSFSTDGLKTMLKEAIFLQPPFHFFETNGLFVTTFGYNGQIVKVLHQLLIPFDRENHTCLFAIGINYILFLHNVHFTPLLDPLLPHPSSLSEKDFGSFQQHLW
jgi:hypothetical protein